MLILRFFTGNEALNGGLVGAGLGALGATILGPAGAQHSSTSYPQQRILYVFQK